MSNYHNNLSEINESEKVKISHQETLDFLFRHNLSLDDLMPQTLYKKEK